MHASADKNFLNCREPHVINEISTYIWQAMYGDGKLNTSSRMPSAKCLSQIYNVCEAQLNLAYPCTSTVKVFDLHHCYDHKQRIKLEPVKAVKPQCYRSLMHTSLRKVCDINLECYIRAKITAVIHPASTSVRRQPMSGTVHSAPVEQLQHLEEQVDDVKVQMDCCPDVLIQVVALDEVVRIKDNVACATHRQSLGRPPL